MSRSITVSTNVQVDLRDIGSDDLIAELKSRSVFLGDDETDQRSFDRLADFIAEGRIGDALDLLHRLAPCTHRPETVVRLASLRKSAA